MSFVNNDKQDGSGDVAEDEEPESLDWVSSFIPRINSKLPRKLQRVCGAIDYRAFD
jgi:hypothetical protein